jgi:hypothetical protein
MVKINGLNFIAVLFLLLLTACYPEEALLPVPYYNKTELAQIHAAKTQAAIESSNAWILIAAENGLWVMNEDSSALTQLTQDRIIAPSGLNLGLSSRHAYFAYVTASDMFSLTDLKLKIIQLPGGEVKASIDLISSNMKPSPNAEMCDPKVEASRAAAMDALQWSPDGSKLAFVGATADSADVYLYALQDGGVTRVSDEPGQAYDLHWSPGSEKIIYFSASCFGTGAGFNMDGAWVTDLKLVKTEKLYDTDKESWGEKFIAWSRSGAESFFVSTYSGCPQRDLRLVDVPSKQTTTIHEGCFEGVAVGPTSSLAVLTSADFSDKPGLYLYSEPDIIGVQPVYAPLDNGRKVLYAGSQFLVTVAGEGGGEVRSFKWDGSAGWYQSTGGLPFIAPDEQVWAWNEGETFYLKTRDDSPSITLSETIGAYALWNEDITASGEILQRLYYFSGAHGDELYISSAPDYKPALVAKNLSPLFEPIVIYK